MRAWGVLAVLLLGACGQQAPSDKAPSANAGAATADAGNAGLPRPARPASSLSLALQSEGLQLVDRDGKTYPIAFGVAEDQALRQVSQARGALVDQGDNDECGAGPLSYANFEGNLALLFQDGKFAGWSVNEGGDTAITTTSGIGLGATRAALEKAYQTTVEESTIGTEFTAGGLSGLLDGKGPSAKITDIWAGVTCIAR